MMKTTQRFHECFSVRISLPKDRLIESILHEKRMQKESSGLTRSTHLDFQEVTLTDDDYLVIRVKGSSLSAGSIHMFLSGNKEEAETRIEGEIVPYDADYLHTVYVLMGFLALWTVAAFLVSAGPHTVAMAALGWTVFPLMLYLTPLRNRSRLREHRNFFLVNITRGRRLGHERYPLGKEFAAKEA